MAAVGDPHPRVRRALARARGVLASVQRELGDLAGARAVLEEAVAAVERARAEATGDERAALDEELAKALFEQADVLLARREWPAAIAAWTRSAELAQAGLERAPNPAAARRHLWRCRLGIAQAQAQSSDPEAAVAACQEVVAALEGADEPDLMLRARTLLAAVLMHAGRYRDARPELEATIELRTRRQEEDARDVGNLRDLKSAHHNLGHLLQMQEDMPGARTHLEHAAGIARRLVEAFPGRVETKLTLVSSLMVLGNVCIRMADAAAAEAACREAVALAEALAAAHPDIEDVTSALAEARSTLAQVILDDDARRGEAVALLEAAERAHAALAAAPSATAQSLTHWGTTLGLLASGLSLAGRPAESRAAEDRALAVLAEAAGRLPDNPIVRGNTARVVASSIARALRAEDQPRVREVLGRAAAAPGVEREVWKLLESLPAPQFAAVRKLWSGAEAADRE
jgi:tetratricopeptide (TPR) repeat protein